MARIFGTSPDGKTVSIDKNSVREFFEERAVKAETVGDLSAVIYQDKNPTVAIERDRAEKKLLKQKLMLQPGLRVLDLGCGNGRWAREILDAGCIYQGVDASVGLIAQAQEKYSEDRNASFRVGGADEINAEVIGSNFDRILILGLLIYLNDEDVTQLARDLTHISGAGCRVLLREPMGIESRLTITQHFSEDMDQIYNAIYRTENEIFELISPLMKDGFSVVEKGDVYSEKSLNNRKETRQKWIVLERRA